MLSLHYTLGAAVQLKLPIVSAAMRRSPLVGGAEHNLDHLALTYDYNALSAITEVRPITAHEFGH